MLASTVDLYKNPRGHYNTTQFQAWAVARRAMKFSWNNLRLKFLPPIVMSIVTLPFKLDLSVGFPESPFEPDMFVEGGFLYETPLNHSIRMLPSGCTHSILVNAGWLASHFLESDRQGYMALREVLNIAKKENATYKASNSAKAAGDVQEEGVTPKDRDISSTSGDNHQGK